MKAGVFFKRTTAISTIVLVAVVATACRSPRRGEAVGRTVQKTSASIEHGRTMFQEHCYRCHPGGEGGLGPALNNKPAPRFLMKTQVRVGLGAMPSFSKDDISPKELDQLMDYVMALRKAH
jgi:mono/diheme cytochrome c family protein